IQPPTMFTKFASMFTSPNLLPIVKNSAVMNEELKKVYKFKDPLSNEQKDVIAIASLLSDQQRVMQQLEKLENILAERKKTGNYHEYNPKRPGLYKHNKLLSGFLYDWLEKNKFEGKAKLYDAVAPLD